MSSSPRLRVAALLVGAALSLGPAVIEAQDACSQREAARSWSAPLDRRIALRARDVSLREALDRIAAAARLRVSYSAEFLPLDRLVCLNADSVSAGDALVAVLVGVDVTSLVTGPDQIVIAPVRPREAPRRESVQTLDRVVVTGSATGGAQRPLTVALDVLDGRKLAEQTNGGFSAAFDGTVPGLWMWEQGSSSLLARYGSIRGASSFGVSYPKFYIDGIEVANPLLLTEMNPAVIDRIEVIRGPQGAALYGADAISGVINVITRHEGTPAGAHRTELVSRAGVSQTEYARGSVLAQNHSVSWRAGPSTRSGSLAMSLNTLGGYVPDAYSRDLKVNGGFRVVTSTASITGTARYSGKQAAAGENPLLRSLAGPSLSQRSSSRSSSIAALSPADSLLGLHADSLPQHVNSYTLGTTATFLTGTIWTPSFTAGVDGYRVKNLSNDLAIVPTPIDTSTVIGSGDADRVTFRTALVGQFDLAARSALTLTFALEHSSLRETISQFEGTSNGGTELHFRPASTWRKNSGLVGQANLSLADAMYLTGGLRIERNDAFSVSNRTVALPMLGAAYVRDLGPWTVKLRAAYGVGIRPTRSVARDVALSDDRRFGLNPSLDPERQAGVEFGADFFHDDRFAAHLTRFDQTASNLIQAVAVPRDSDPSGTASGSSKQLTYVLQNVGEISNRGWELELSMRVGRLSLGGAFTAVDSRVQRIARGYTGDLVVGGRMLGVPAFTASMSTGWLTRQWSASLTATRALDWVNYDRLRLADDYARCSSAICDASDWTNVPLRRYWKTYSGVTRLRGTMARELPRGLGLRLTVDNITNQQHGEPDNLTVVPGRTVLLGVSAKIR